MRIGIVIGRIGGVDGVALETEKWITVLNRLGHTSFILTGELEASMPDVTILEELAFSHSGCIQDQKDAFFEQEISEDELVARLKKDAAYIEHKILDWIEENDIDVILNENSTTLPCHLTMGLALKNVIENSEIQAVAHDHDFAWERGERYKTKYKSVKKIIADCFPPDLPNLKHAVINTNCYNVIHEKTGIYPLMVPNVMDFDEPFGLPDEYNSDLRSVLGLKEDDIALFQITRIVSRKGIETAIQLVKRLEDSRIKLFITGNDIDNGQEYCIGLKKLIKELDLEEQVFFVDHLFDNVRTTRNGKKVYSLSDGYAISRAITYFSTYEGFGNGYLEAVVAKKPIFVNNYKPVYWPDIGSKGFRTVQIEDNILTDDSVKEMKKIIYDENLGTEIGEFNYILGKKHFSFDNLEILLKQLFDFSEML